MMAPPMGAARYQVKKGNVAVLQFRAQPGQLLSTAPRPPGFKPPPHPFLDGQALDAGQEAKLAALLAAATSAADFIAALKREGFTVIEERAT